MDQEKIGQFIGQLRKEKNMTQKELAAQIGVSDKTISKWETGNGLPDISSFDALCRALEINVNELLSGEKLPPEIYSEKAEENMMNLLEENQRTKKTMWLQFGFGAGLLLFGIFFLLMSMFGVEGVMTSWTAFADWPSLIVLVLFTGAMALLAGPKDKASLVSNIRKSILPSGFMVTIFSVMTVLLYADFDGQGQYLGLNVFCFSMEIALLPLLYAIIGYMIFWTAEERMKMKG